MQRDKVWFSYARNKCAGLGENLPRELEKINQEMEFDLLDLPKVKSRDLLAEICEPFKNQSEYSILLYVYDTY